MEEEKIQEIRDGFDELFLGSSNEITEKSNELFTALGIEGFAEIVARAKKYGFNTSQKILSDLVKLSFLVYTNLDNLPLQRKVILPQENGSYKFIVTFLPHIFLRGSSNSEIAQENTNILFLVSTGDDMHAKIAKKIGLNGISGEINILGGARIDVDHENKILNIRDDSGSYGSCSDQIIERLLEEYKNQGYEIKTKMSYQGIFFQD